MSEKKTRIDWSFMNTTINFMTDLCVVRVIDQDILLLNDAFLRYFNMPKKATYSISFLTNFFGSTNYNTIFANLITERQHIFIQFQENNHRFNRACERVAFSQGDYYLHRYIPLGFTSKESKLNSSKFLQMVMDNIPQRIFWKDRESVYLGCNQKFADAAGMKTPKDIIGKTDYDLPWEKQQADFFRVVDQKVMNNDQPIFGITTPITLADGKKSWVRSNKIPLKDQDTIIGILGTYEDISAIKKQKELIENQLELLNQQKNELETFAYATSHDMKAPLRTIISFSQLLQRSLRGRLKQNEQEYLDFIISATKNQRELVDGILRFSSLNQHLKLKNTDVSKLIAELLLELGITMQESKAQVNMLFSDVQIMADTLRLKQLFQNLILNSIKFTKPNTIPVINIDFKDMDDSWLFSVEDNGIGIDLEFKERVFQLFEKLHTTDKFEGTGIGLAICKKIVSRHKGQIWIESEKGNGTTFFFTISKNI